jgi:hypothetical protein
MPIYNKFYAGEAKSRFDQEGFDSTDNLDVHTELGSARCQLALALESSTPNEPCVSAVVPNGDSYFCSTTTGKIWKRTQAGVYSLVRTNAYTSHTGCKYYNGYLYYWTNTKLGRFDLSSSWNDGFATFSNGQALGAEEVNLTLWICDGKYIASVNSSGTFSANALDFPANYLATTLIGYENGLLVGTRVSNYVTACKAYLWDTWSDSWTIEDEIFELGINVFIRADNIILVQAGTAGVIYYWTGAKMELLGRIRNVTTSSGYQKSAVLNGKPLVAIGTDIYSIYKSDLDYPIAITHEYTATGAITSLTVMGTQLLASTASGVNYISTNRATAKAVTPEAMGTFSLAEVGYSSLPAGTSIGIETSVDGSAYASQTPIVDSVNKKVYFDGGLENSNFIQARITLNPATSLTPIITYINIT